MFGKLRGADRGQFSQSHAAHAVSEVRCGLPLWFAVSVQIAHAPMFSMPEGRPRGDEVHLEAWPDKVFEVLVILSFAKQDVQIVCS